MSLEPIRIVVVVDRNPAETFDAFTRRVSEWWPLQTHSVSPYMGEPAPDTVVIERREDGDIFEVSQSGERRLWGKVLDYVEGKRLSFTWHPGLAVTQATRVSVAFESTDHNKTVVTLVHEGWEARGADASSMRETYHTGWQTIIQERFVMFVHAHIPIPSEPS